jgi:uncharacterized tellurite resistance protein B-like protein
MTILFDSEAAAGAAILFSCILHDEKGPADEQWSQLSRAMRLCSRFQENDLQAISQQAFSLQETHSIESIIEQATPLITAEFRETLFAMVCEVLLLDGSINERRTALLARIALELEISVEQMKMMLTACLIRNRWNSMPEPVRSNTH